MADSVFLFRRQLRKSLGQPQRLKDWIVTEAGMAARRIDNHPFNHALEPIERLTLARKRQHTTKTRAKRLLIGKSSKFCQQSRNIFFIGGLRSGIARGINAGRTAERIDL